MTNRECEYNWSEAIYSAIRSGGIAISMDQFASTHDFCPKSLQLFGIML